MCGEDDYCYICKRYEDRIKALEEEVERLKSVLDMYDKDWEFIEEKFDLLDPILTAIKEKLDE